MGPRGPGAYLRVGSGSCHACDHSWLITRCLVSRSMGPPNVQPPLSDSETRFQSDLGGALPVRSPVRKTSRSRGTSRENSCLCYRTLP